MYRDEEKKYGRKVVRSSRKRKRTNYKQRFMMVCLIFTLIGAILGSIITGIIVHKIDVEKSNKLSTEEVQTIKEVHIYGADDVINNQTLNWSSGEELGFIPLDVPMDEDLQEYTYCLCYCYDVDFSLVMALIEHESKFNAGAVSNTGDYGLMQINEGNFEWLSDTLGVSDYLDEKQNIRAGVYVIRKLFEQYGDDTHKVLMAYNMGSSTAENLWSQGIEQSSYSIEIVDNASIYRKSIKERDGE